MKYFALFIALLFSGFVNATCQTKDTYLSTIDAGNIIVQRDAPIGTQIGSVQAQVATVLEAICINGGQSYGQFDYMGGVPTSIPGVYYSNIPGVGIAIYGWTGIPSGTITNPPTYYQMAAVGTGTINIWSGSNVSSVRFFKVGNIVSGSFAPGRIGHQTTVDDGGILRDFEMVSGSVTQVACSIRTPNLVFPLGNVPVSDFGTTPGFIPARTSTQNLGLDCDAGANINVSLNGTQNPDSSDTSVMALNNQGAAGVATGVGIQLVYNGAPLVLNNNIVLKTSTGGLEMLPITARYFQTKDAVTVGDASTSATLQLTYQ